MKMSTLVNERMSATDLNPDFVADVSPMKSEARRDLFGWDGDSYGTFTLRVYVPKGEALPKGGICLKAEDFDRDRGVAKTNRGRTSILHESELGTDDKGAPDHLLVILETPEDYDFESVTIKQ